MKNSYALPEQRSGIHCRLERCSGMRNRLAFPERRSGVRLPEQRSGVHNRPLTIWHSPVQGMEIAEWMQIDLKTPRF